VGEGMRACLSGARPPHTRTDGRLPTETIA
jgi:hypothetical protein